MAYPIYEVINAYKLPADLLDAGVKVSFSSSVKGIMATCELARGAREPKAKKCNEHAAGPDQQMTKLSESK
ncbi:hypothetical protein D3C83_227520 [compost metagenome]